MATIDVARFLKALLLIGIRRERERDRQIERERERETIATTTAWPEARRDGGQSSIVVAQRGYRVSRGGGRWLKQ